MEVATTRYQVAFLTGQSDPSRCALSPAQEAFLQALELPPGVGCRQNFPFDPETPPHRPVPLLSASWHNGWQYLVSRRATFRRRYATRISQLVRRCPETVFLAGSCGLELLTNLRLPEDDLARIRVFAYGPVARSLPAVKELLVVQGFADPFSRCYFSQPHHRIPCGHLDYLAHPETLDLCRNFLSRTYPPS